MTPHTGKSSRRSVSPVFLATLLILSITANGIFLVRLHYPNQWQKFRQMFKSPPVETDTDHARGLPDSPVTVIEFSDFQCPYSAEFHLAMGALSEEMDIRWIYRHFPLVDIHPLAVRAAEAAECAGEQDLFWEYSEILFLSQEAISEDIFYEIAWNLPLDLEAFKVCLESGRFRGRIAAQRKDALSSNVSGTPTFYINGNRFEGALSYSELKSALSAADGGLPQPAGICE